MPGESTLVLEMCSECGREIMMRASELSKTCDGCGKIVHNTHKVTSVVIVKDNGKRSGK